MHTNSNEAKVLILMFFLSLSFLDNFVRVNPPGRMPTLAPSLETAFKDAIKKRTMEGHGFALTGQFLTFAEPWIRETMRLWNVPNYAAVPLPFDDDTIGKMYRHYCTGKVRQGDEQNAARFRRRVNLGGHICDAAVTYALMSGSDGLLSPWSHDAIKHGLLFNEDDFSLVLEDQFGKRTVRGDKDTMKAMRQKHQG